MCSIRSGIVMLDNPLFLRTRSLLLNGPLQTVQCGNIKMFINCLISKSHFVVDEALIILPYTNHRLARIKILHFFNQLLPLFKICVKELLLVAINNVTPEYWFCAEVRLCRARKAPAIMKHQCFVYACFTHVPIFWNFLIDFRCWYIIFWY